MANLPANPVLAALSVHAGNTGWPISGFSVVAPLVGAAPLLVIRWAQWRGGSFEPAGHDGIAMMSMEREPDTVVEVPPMMTIEPAALAAAWAFGAWDMTRTVIGPGYAGALPPELCRLGELVRAHGYVTWAARPMLQGPPLRIKAHAPNDPTLNPWSLGRDGPMPPLRLPAMTPDTSYTVQFGPRQQHAGRSAGRPGRRRRPLRATINQINYIFYLRRRLGEPGGDPMRLSYAEASATIDALKARL